MVELMLEHPAFELGYFELGHAFTVRQARWSGKGQESEIFWALDATNIRRTRSVEPMNIPNPVLHVTSRMSFRPSHTALSTSRRRRREPYVEEIGSVRPLHRARHPDLYAEEKCVPNRVQ